LSYRVQTVNDSDLQAKQDADHLLKEKVDLEKEKKKTEDEALAKEKARDKKCKLIGNYVHESVPVNDNEVSIVSALSAARAIADNKC